MDKRMDLTGVICPYCGRDLVDDYGMKVGIYSDSVFERDVLCHMVCAEQRDVHYEMELKCKVIHQFGADRFKYRPFSLVNY